MKTVKIVDKQTLQIETTYQAPQADIKAYGGKWGRPEEVVHLEVPAGLDPDCVKAVLIPESWTLSDGSVVTTDPQDPTATHTPEHIELQEDATLVAQKTQAERDQKLAELRRQRDEKLKKADTVIFTEEDKATPDTTRISNWRTYRNDLRVLTDSYKDATDPQKGTSALDPYALDMSDFDQWPVQPA